MRWLLLAVLAAARFEDPQATASIDVAASKLTVSLAARGKFHLNDDYPINFVPAAAAGVTYAAAKVSKDQLTFTPCADHPDQRCAASLSLAFTGKGQVGGLLAFAVCDPETCVIKKVPLSATAP